MFAPAPAAARGAAEIPGIFTVLAPTDLSADGNRAVGFAYALLAGHGGVVELGHVHERALPSPAYAYDRPEGKLSEADRARLVAELRALVPAEAERLGITTHVTVIDGREAARAILQAAERLLADSVVLGSHGRGRALPRAAGVRFRGGGAPVAPAGPRRSKVEGGVMSTTMKAAVFQGKGKIGIREVPRPEPGVGEALIKVTLTTICGTDVHILKGEYPVREGLIVGHEPVGVIEALGPGVTGYAAAIG